MLLSLLGEYRLSLETFSGRQAAQRSALFMCAVCWGPHLVDQPNPNRSKHLASTRHVQIRARMFSHVSQIRVTLTNIEVMLVKLQAIHYKCFL
jgi:hypothetical protein